MIDHKNATSKVNSLTFYFRDDRMPNHEHLASRLSNIFFNRENKECMEYLPNYEYYKDVNKLNGILNDIHYLRRYCKHRSMFLKEVVFNIGLPDFKNLLRNWANKNGGVYVESYTRVALKEDKKHKHETGGNIEFLFDDDIEGSD